MIIPKSSLIVSCQAPIYSPLFEPKIIAAMAKASINQGAKGVRSRGGGARGRRHSRADC